jgi:3-oxoacyl-[acyl-carrier protein] reductase
MSNILEGKTALVTGAKSGNLGDYVCRHLVREGCKVVGIDKERFDLACETDLNKLVESVLCQKGRVDILVNCAGVLPAECLHDFLWCMAVNVRAPWYLTQLLAPKMIERKWGRIVNVASAAAYRGTAGKAIYCASKHALLGLSRSLYKELRTHGIRVFCVSPEAMQTDMGRKLKDSGPFETFIKPESVAEFIVQLISQNDEMISEEVKLNRISEL